MAIKDEYRKERKRIQQFINRAEKRGYQFDFEMPEIPKNITSASVNRLKRITPEKLYKKSVYGGEATQGEIISGTEGRKLERILAGQRAAETRRLKTEYDDGPDYPYVIDTKPIPKKDDKDKIIGFQRIYEGQENFYDEVVLSTFYGELDAMGNAPMHNLMKAFMDGLIQQKGKAAVARAIDEAYRSGHPFTWQVMYKDEEFNEFIGAILDFIPDEGALFKDEWKDKLEIAKNITETAEIAEVWEDFG